MSHLIVLKQVTQAIEDYLLHLPKRGVGKHHTPQELKKILEFTLPNVRQDSTAMMADVTSYLDHAVATLHPTFMNQLFAGSRPWAMAGEMLAAVTNSTMATFEASPLATLMERTLIAHWAQMIGWTEHDGIMVTGGSNANLVALLMARNRAHPEIRLEGATQKKLTAFVSEEAHYSFEKAFNIMGLGSKNLISVNSDEEGRMIPQALSDAIHASRARQETPFFIGATAGTTVLGAFDPIAALAKIARQDNIWLHVDGAWGGSALISPKHRALLAGLELVDSFGVDTHKMLATRLVSSFFLTRHPHALRQSHAGGGGDYIFHPSEAGASDLGPSSLQCGRKVDALKVWLAWRSLGDQGMAALVDQLFANAQAASKLIQENSAFKLVHDPVFLNVCFKVKSLSDTAGHRLIRENLMREGKAMVNIATRRKETFIRLIVAHPEQDSEVLKTFLTDVLASSQNITKTD